MLNWSLSVLVHKGILTFEEAEHLAKELVLKTHPTRFADAHVIVEKVLGEYKKTK